MSAPASSGAGRSLARISQTIAVVTEATLPTGQERREERIGKTVERLDAACRKSRPALRVARSEEHTSELQSLMRISYAVFCLKKKSTHIIDKLNTRYKYRKLILATTQTDQRSN